MSFTVIVDANKWDVDKLNSNLYVLNNTAFKFQIDCRVALTGWNLVFEKCNDGGDVFKLRGCTECGTKVYSRDPWM